LTPSYKIAIIIAVKLSHQNRAEVQLLKFSNSALCIG